MRDFSVEEGLRKDLQKLAKPKKEQRFLLGTNENSSHFVKDKVMHEAVMKKFEEIISCFDINHYKNLRAPLQEFKRVHIKSSFVLLFKYIASEDKVVFYKLDHHDTIYR